MSRYRTETAPGHLAGMNGEPSARRFAFRVQLANWKFPRQYRGAMNAV